MLFNSINAFIYIQINIIIIIEYAEECEQLCVRIHAICHCMRAGADDVALYIYFYFYYMHIAYIICMCVCVYQSYYCYLFSLIICNNNINNNFSFIYQ